MPMRAALRRPLSSSAEPPAFTSASANSSWDCGRCPPMSCDLTVAGSRCPPGWESPQGSNFRLIQNFSRVTVAGLAVGVARAALDHALRYAKERLAFGRPIAQFQSIAFMLAEMRIEIDAARLMIVGSGLESGSGTRGDPRVRAGGAAGRRDGDAGRRPGRTDLRRPWLHPGKSSRAAVAQRARHHLLAGMALL